MKPRHPPEAAPLRSRRDAYAQRMRGDRDAPPTPGTASHRRTRHRRPRHSPTQRSPSGWSSRRASWRATSTASSRNSASPPDPNSPQRRHDDPVTPSRRSHVSEPADRERSAASDPSVRERCCSRRQRARTKRQSRMSIRLAALARYRASGNARFDASGTVTQARRWRMPRAADSPRAVTRPASTSDAERRLVRARRSRAAPPAAPDQLGRQQAYGPSRRSRCPVDPVRRKHRVAEFGLGGLESR